MPQFKAEYDELDAQAGKLMDEIVGFRDEMKKIRKDTSNPKEGT